MTLNQIFDLLKKFADDHLQINEFGRGPTNDIMLNQTQLFPGMWAATNGPVTYTGHAANHRMMIIFFDQLMDGKANEIEVQSDMLTVALDLAAYLTDNPDLPIWIDGDPSIDYFTENFTHLCAGVALTFTLKDPKPLDRCEIPFS